VIDPALGNSAPATGTEPVAAGGALVTPQRMIWWSRAARWTVVGVFVLMIVTFSILKPHSFPTGANLKAILDQAALFAVLGAGLTVVLVIGEFDLSFDAASAIAGSAAVMLMVHSGFPVPLAVVAAIGVGVLVGSANGVIVAYGRAPAFIGTLAVASVASGAESWFTKDKPTYEGIKPAYENISGSEIFGIPLTIVISIGCVLLAWFLLSFTVYGRRAHAVGANPAAATLAGIQTKRIRFGAFVFMGAMAGIAGVIITSRAGGAFPNSAIGVLLPTYTAAFLGASALGRGQFHPLGTYFGVIFIGSLQTGLTMLQAPGWTSKLVTGFVLVMAVLVALRK
jgi:ribose/xylose/arabinose/galactoside ABC-type transport system permease subunit